ncbi:MAG: hypothetical protein FD123_663 [Bacteroidetes bacterium]|nr:MAG: hypothetical protein FD123_663 [Bacteroidota bacterium]
MVKIFVFKHIQNNDVTLSEDEVCVTRSHLHTLRLRSV